MDFYPEPDAFFACFTCLGKSFEKKKKQWPWPLKHKKKTWMVDVRS